jgi:hypothetical protein
MEPALWSCGVKANILLVPTHKGEAPLFAAQRGR